MAQISLPYRIALIALLVVSALWFTVLRPKPPAATPVTSQAPGVTGLQTATTAANGAAAASQSSAGATQAAANAGSAPATTASSATAGAAAAPAATATAAAARAKSAAASGVAKGDLSAPLLTAIDSDHAVVLLFWNKGASDDRAVRDAVAATNRRNGRVVVRMAAAGDVGRYEAITRGVQVLETPTVLVIGPRRTAKPIVGMTSAAEVDQAVADALAGTAKK